MKTCIRCGRKNAEYKHFNGGFVCENCIGDYFTCPDCGIIYDSDDYVHGDAGNGFCAKCAPEH